MICIQKLITWIKIRFDSIEKDPQSAIEVCDTSEGVSEEAQEKTNLMEENNSNEASGWRTIDSVIARAKELIGRTLAEEYPEIEISVSKSKGHLGELIEEHHFGLEINNESRPDFENLGVELKTSPLRKTTKGKLSAKERISLGMIDYFQIVEERFHTSGFWKKNEQLLIMFYIHTAKPVIHRRFHLADLWHFSKSDLIIIEQDWNYIKTKVAYGLAHELSEGDTMYLGAATKGASKNSLREQPNATEKAMSRAYSLKTSYVNRIIQAWLNPVENECLLIPEEDALLLEERGFDDLILNRFRPFYGWDILDIAEALRFENFNPLAKSSLAQLARAIMGVPGRATIPEFEAAGIAMKTIRLKPNGTPQESMSFPAFQFTELVREKSWEDSLLFQRLEESRFLFVVFEIQGAEKEASVTLKHAKFWNMPRLDIREARKSWVLTRDIVANGNIVQYVKDNGDRKTNFPGAAEFPVVHVRPHATTTDDTHPLPTPDRITGSQDYTKQSFWLGNKYLGKVISLTC